MNELEKINVDTKDLVEKSQSIKKIADDYSSTLKELYDLFSKLKDNGVIMGGVTIDNFISSIKNNLVEYNKLSTEIKRRFDIVENFANDLDSSIRRIENDKVIL